MITFCIIKKKNARLYIYNVSQLLIFRILNYEETVLLISVLFLSDLNMHKQIWSKQLLFFPFQSLVYHKHRQALLNII
jgi:hypothetical protein